MSFRLVDGLSCEARISFLSSQVGSVFHYKDENISDLCRWYFFIGYEEDSFYFVLPQKNVNGRLIARGEKRNNLLTMVIANQKDYCELRLESIFDCNSIIERNRDWLISICNNGQFQIRNKCSDILLNQIVSATQNSPLISPKVKEIIKKCNGNS